MIVRERDEGFIRKHANVSDVLAVISDVMTAAYGSVMPAPHHRTAYIN